MGNDNSQITFPIEANNNKIQFNSKKLKQKSSSNNNNIQINPKLKNHKGQKTTKNYIVPRISTTPDRNINIPGMNKNQTNIKRYISYDKQLKGTQNTENKNTFKKKEIKNKKIKSNKIWNNKSIINITNLLNSIYTYEIDKRINKTNELHLGLNNHNEKNINFMFDAIFKFSYFFKNTIKPIKIRSNSKNKNNKNNKSNSNSPKQPEDNNTKIKNINYNINNKNNIDNNKYIKNTPPKINGTKNSNLNNNIKNINQNTTLILNKYDLEDEVISINNKKKNNFINHINHINNNLPNKKYSESRYITDSESGFISQEEISLMNNIVQIDNKKIKAKEEDASESQTDKQEIIKHNITNKNKLNNNNYFKDNNAQLNPKTNFNINNNINKYDNKNESKNYKNMKINTNDTIKSNILDKEEEIVLSNSESQNTTYLEILLTMNENKNESIINNIKNEYYNNKNKKYKKISNINIKTNETKKQITPPNIPIRREITPPNINNKRLTLNIPANKIQRTTTNTINNDKIINKTKKITPTKKMQINININGYGTKTNFNKKQCSITNNSNSPNKINNVINNNNTVNINNVYSPKKISKNSLSKNKINNSNFSSKKTQVYKMPNNSKIINTNKPILTYNNNINRKQCINNIRNKKNSDSISPTNSPNPSPTNHINNNYKDKYSYKKMAQMNNSIKKKAIDTNNISNQYSINTSNNIHYNYNDKSSTLYSKINTNNTTKRTNYNYINNNNKKFFRNSANKNKIIFFKKERLSGNSFNNKIQENNTNEAVEVETRTKSNDQKYSSYSSKIVLATTKKKIK